MLLYMKHFLSMIVNIGGDGASGTTKIEMQ